MAGFSAVWKKTNNPPTPPKKKKPPKTTTKTPIHKKPQTNQNANHQKNPHQQSTKTPPTLWKFCLPSARRCYYRAHTLCMCTPLTNSSYHGKYSETPSFLPPYRVELNGLKQTFSFYSELISSSSIALLPT